MTTSLTIYGFGLRGNSAYKSIRKHRFWTKKHQKVNKSSQKTMAYLFGNWRPGVRISTLRPKREQTAPRLSVFFFVGVADESFTLRSRMEFAYTLRRSTSSLVRRSKRISSHSEHLHTSTKKRTDSPKVVCFLFCWCG